MWRESQCRDANNESSACGRTAATAAASSNRYRKAPPSPKNALQHKSSTVSTHSNASDNSAGSRSRRRFFPDSDSSRRCRTRIRFDWKLTTPEPVQSLQLDGSLEDPPTPQRKSLYEPPSPVESALRRLAHWKHQSINCSEESTKLLWRYLEVKGSNAYMMEEPKIIIRYKLMKLAITILQWLIL